jgi:PhnB protein
VTQSTSPADFKPAGWPTVTPRIIVPDAAGLVEFVKRVFNASGDYKPQSPAELKIGESAILVSDAGVREQNLSCLYVYVENVDDTWRRAVAAGALSLEAPFDTPYGDRRGMVKDRWGNMWQIATRIRE